MKQFKSSQNSVDFLLGKMYVSGMTEILDRNLEALNRVYPEAALAIRSVPDSGMVDFRYEEAKNGGMPCAVYRDTHWLCSPGDPMAEAERWVNANGVGQESDFVYVGLGMGYHILRHVMRYRQFCRSILIIEQSAYVCRCVMEAVDLTGLIQLPGFRLAIGYGADRIKSLVTPDMHNSMLCGRIKTMLYGPSMAMAPDYYEAVYKQLSNLISRSMINLRTMVGQRSRNTVNALANLSAHWLALKPSDVYERLKGVPAFIVGAGPSLDKNVHELHDVHNKGIIVAVDTAQTTLKESGVHPDFIISADPTPLNFRHYDGIDDLGDAVLAFHPETFCNIVQKYADHRRMLSLIDPECLFYTWLDPPSGEPGFFADRAMNCGQIAFNLARHMGCDPIVLVGMDLAFSRDGGYTHASKAAVSRIISAPDETGRANIEAMEGKIAEESGTVLWVDGYDGEPVPTPIAFAAYIRDMEVEIAKTDGMVIDATEGGALKKGSKFEALSSVVHVLPELHWTDIHNIFQPGETIKDPAPILEKLREAEQVFCESRELLQRMKGELEWFDHVEEIEFFYFWSQINALWMKANKNHLIQTVTGQAISHLIYIRQALYDQNTPDLAHLRKSLRGKYEYMTAELLNIVEQFNKILNIVIGQFEKMEELYREGL